MAFQGWCSATISCAGRRIRFSDSRFYSLAILAWLSHTRAQTRAAALINTFSTMSASHNRYELTPEQQALAEEKRQQRLRQKEQPATPQEDPRSKILAREWLKLADPPKDTVRVKIMTWNVCTTFLVRMHNYVWY